MEPTDGRIDGRTDGRTDGSGAGDPTRFYPPRWRLLVLVLTCLFLAAVSYVPTLSAFGALVWSGWVMLVLFALAAVVLLLRAVRPGPTVMIDEHGITDRTTLAPVGRIDWADITVIRKKEIGRGMGAERLLEIVLADPAGYRTRPRSWLRRLTEGYRAALRQPVVSIPGSMVSVPMQQVIDAIQRRRPQLEVLAGPPAPPSKFRFAPKPPARRQHPDLPRW